MIVKNHVTGSWDCLFSSNLLAASVRVFGKAIPTSTHKLLVLVALRQQVIIRQVSFKVGSRRLSCADRSHTEQAHFAAE